MCVSMPETHVGYLLRRWSVKVMVVHSERGTSQQKDTLQGREIIVGTCFCHHTERKCSVNWEVCGVISITLLRWLNN